MKHFNLSLVFLLLVAWTPAFAQQTGSLGGKVTTPGGEAIPGVTVEADGDVLPRARTAVTNASGEYRFQLLPPGNYQVGFSLSGLGGVTQEVRILLQQHTTLHVKMQPAEVTEELEVVGEMPVIDTTSAEIKTAIDSQTIALLPVGQEYRDLVKLIPGVQYTEDSVRGPSAGGSGQDNVYQFDGVNVGLPLFGTLSSEPSSHDIDQVAVVKGGAKAVDFNRSGGFTINSISKSGTNALHGQASFQLQSESFTSARDTGSSLEFDEDKDWTVFGIGGPIASERLFFYASYYRPTTNRGNRSNLYGAVPDQETTRDELFGKLTFTPTGSFLLNASYRDSDRDGAGEGITSELFDGSISEGSDATLKIATVEGSWVTGDSGYLSFKLTDFENQNSGRPDDLLGFDVATDGSARLDVANLDRQGLLLVPQPLAGEDAYNAFIAPIIGRYGYDLGGVAVGGGRTGVGSTINDQDFFRESWEVAYDVLFGRHDLHFGYQWSRDEEDLSRTSNGWGVISVPGGRTTFNGMPIFYEARFEQQSVLSAGGVVVPAINSQFESQSFEVNDTLKLDKWTFSLGVVLSNDELFGEGLRESPSSLSGFELAPGNRYKMYEIGFDEMIQPRLSATWAYNRRDTVYASYARYHPAASSLPRAASWARNLRASIRGFFDADGNLIGSDPVASSSGKFFQEGLDPRSIDEYVIGHSREMSSRWTGKAHLRYRKGAHFWEDTNNTARVDFAPPPGIPQEAYIPDLNLFRSEVGGSSYVIAELDGAYTKYYEASIDAQWRGSKAYFQGSYVWSHYYGNFDQDNTTTENDDAIFIGSSFIADGAGRQLWNFREGDLRGDRRHLLKLYGFYNFDWNGSAGVYAIYQSGQPWEAWDVEVYRFFTTSTSDTSRFAEPAGSRTTSDHYQIDLNYTQNFRFGGRYNVQLRADLFNAFDKQTGYNIQNKVNEGGFGDPRDFFNPRRLQLAVKLEF
jgi:hypothetical protein